MGKLELVQTLIGHKERVWNVSWHPKGEILASCGEDITIRLWCKVNDKWINKTILTEGHQRAIRQVAWSPQLVNDTGSNTALLASASFDATVSIWEQKSNEFECNLALEGHDNEVKSVAWSASGQFLATCSRDKTVWIWELTNSDEFECVSVLNAHTQDVKKVIWHPNIDLLASASYDNTVKLFREDPIDNDWYCVDTLSSHTSTVWSLAFNKRGDRLATCSDDCTVKIWQQFHPDNVQGIEMDGKESVWKCVCTLTGYHTRTIYDIAWCHHRDLIATACGDDVIRIFKEDPSNSQEITFSLVNSQERAHSQDVNSVNWNPVVPGLLASSSDDGEVKIWQFKD